MKKYLLLLPLFFVARSASAQLPPIGASTDKAFHLMEGKYKYVDTVFAGNGDIQAIRFAPVSFHGYVGMIACAFDTHRKIRFSQWSRDDFAKFKKQLAGMDDPVMAKVDADLTSSDANRLVEYVSADLGKPHKLVDPDDEDKIWWSWKKGGNNFILSFDNGAASYTESTK